jgi:hypothetical protein
VPVWTGAEELPPDDGPIEPPPSENPCWAGEEEPVDDDPLEPEPELAAVPGWACRASPRTITKAPVAARATARLATWARLRADSILDSRGMGHEIAPA